MSAEERRRGSLGAVVVSLWSQLLCGSDNLVSVAGADSDCDVPVFWTMCH